VWKSVADDGLPLLLSVKIFYCEAETVLCSGVQSLNPLKFNGHIHC
jgi:hypothetical protein